MKTAPILSLSEFEKKAWKFMHQRFFNEHTVARSQTADAVHQYNTLLSRLTKQSDFLGVELVGENPTDVVRELPLLILEGDEENANIYASFSLNQPIGSIRKDMWVFNLSHTDLPSDYEQISKVEL